MFVFSTLQTLALHSPFSLPRLHIETEIDSLGLCRTVMADTGPSTNRAAPTCLFLLLYLLENRYLSKKMKYSLLTRAAIDVVLSHSLSRLLELHTQSEDEPTSLSINVLFIFITNHQRYFIAESSPESNQALATAVIFSLHRYSTCPAKKQGPFDHFRYLASLECLEGLLTATPAKYLEAGANPSSPKVRYARQVLSPHGLALFQALLVALQTNDDARLLEEFASLLE